MRFRPVGILGHVDHESADLARSGTVRAEFGDRAVRLHKDMFEQEENENTADHQQHGDRYAAAVEQTLDISRTVAAAIRSSRHLELACEPHLSVLLFQRSGWDTASYRDWSQRLAREGVILCLPTTWHGETVLRLAFVNPDTNAERVIDVLDAMA